MDLYGYNCFLLIAIFIFLKEGNACVCLLCELKLKLNF